MAAHTHSPDSDAAFDDVAAALMPAGATEGRMFGCRTLYRGHRMVAVLFDEQLAVRLGRDSDILRDLFAAKLVREWDPTRQEHPFRDWALVGFDRREEWTRLARAAWSSTSD
ncbi:hypothetical protein ACEXQE_04850 [Herbiconiux sp. P17]|uniref:hypothetical protein n=1 Tax=Herbiconiux wuyangfengii TaxID=3342794 RepID=UPI0035B70D9F